MNTVYLRIEALLARRLVSKQTDGSYALTDVGHEAIERIRGKESWIGVIRATRADQPPRTTTEAPAPAPVIIELVSEGKTEGAIGSLPGKYVADRFKTMAGTFTSIEVSSIYGRTYLNGLLRPESQGNT